MPRTMSGPLRMVTVAGLAVACAVAALWAYGALDPVAGWLRSTSRDVQDSLAGAVRALRAGHPGAWAGLLGTCFAYGFLHAAGPGHGKAVMAGYGVARRVALAPLAGLALAASLSQAAFAVVLVYGAIWVLGWGRTQIEGVAEAAFQPVSYAMVGGVGLWLVWRGLRSAARATEGAGHHPRASAQGADGHASHAHSHAHDHDHVHDHTCGHAHGPSVEQVAAVASVRDAAVLVAAIAIRPCSGAIFLLIVTYAMGIGWAGVAGAFAMGLGTAVITVASAGLAFWAREGALLALPGAGLARALPLIEVAVGALIASVSLALLLPLI